MFVYDIVLLVLLLEDDLINVSLKKGLTILENYYNHFANHLWSAADTRRPPKVPCISEKTGQLGLVVMDAIATFLHHARARTTLSTYLDVYTCMLLAKTSGFGK